MDVAANAALLTGGTFFLRDIAESLCIDVSIDISLNMLHVVLSSHFV
jgi:hypothetical protein